MDRNKEINRVFDSSLFERKRRRTNSPEFDKAAYEADGGDSQMDPKRREMLRLMVAADQGLWAQAKEAARHAYPDKSDAIGFTIWYYERHGGKFA